MLVAFLWLPFEPAGRLPVHSLFRFIFQMVIHLIAEGIVVLVSDQLAKPLVGHYFMQHRLGYVLDIGIVG